MAKRYQSKRRSTEDASGLAGWLFTDLLLGLVMIFLSAVAFTAFKSKADAGEVALECKEYVAAFIAEPLSLEFKTVLDAVNIGPQIQDYVDTEQEINGVRQKLKDAKVAVGIIWGYYESGTSSFEGVKRAKEFYSEFIKSDPINFSQFVDKQVENMRFIGSAGENAPLNGVKAELFFVYNSCSKQGPVTSATLP